jgi:hypothetical protein
LPVRVGVWFYPLSYAGCEAEEAVRLGAEAVDIREKLLEVLPDGAQFINLSHAKLFGLIHQVVERPGDNECLLIYNLDLLLARLPYAERQEFWLDMLTTMRHRKHAALIAFPETAGEMAPDQDHLARWNQENRIVGTARTL